MNNFYIIVAILWCFTGCKESNNESPPVTETDAVSCIQVDPLEKIFREPHYTTEMSDATTAVAKGETATIQLVIRSNYPLSNVRIEAGELADSGGTIPVALRSFVNYAYVGAAARDFANPASKDKLPVPESHLYPDPLLEEEKVNIMPGQNQAIWVNYAVPRTATAGDYTAQIHITGQLNGAPFITSKNITVKVYNVTLPEQTLWINNWIDPYSTGVLKFMNYVNTFPLFSDLFWNCHKAIANKMRDYGQNMYRFPALMPGNVEVVSGSGTAQAVYAFPFITFDRIVELYIQEGGLKRFAGNQICARLSGWYDPFGVYVPYVSGDNVNLVLQPFDSDITKNWLNQFIPALWQHLVDKGWQNMFLQYLADEPGTGQSAASYNQIAAYIHNLAPDLKIVEAIHSTPDVVPSTHAFAPLLEDWHKKYNTYKAYQEQCKEIWFYTSMEPVGNYANRFLELPLIQTRILHWLNYQYKATGYIHWGLNSWRTNNWATIE